MKAAVLFKTNSNLKILNGIKVPKLEKGQVLVKIFYASICRSQIMEIEGLRGKDKYLPHLLGHEACAKVLSFGKGVKKVKKNDIVIVTWIKGKGLDVKGAEFYYKGIKINSGPVTTFSDYSIISENRLVPISKKINKKYAPLFGCAVPTGAGMIMHQLNKKSNKTLLIIGMGGTGIFSLVMATCYKFKSITVIDLDKKKLDYAKKIGANYALNPLDTNFKSDLNNITNRIGFDYSIDTAGKVSTIQNAFKYIKNNGLSIFCSHPEYTKKIKIDPFELILGKKIIGSWGGNSKPDKDIIKYWKIIKNKKLDFKKIFLKEYSLNEINKAIKDLKNGKVLRPIINMKKK